VSRARLVIVVCALVAALAALMVFRVRVFVAGGKLVLVLALIALAAWAMWPREKR
jgi:hypothetical protein